jgi:hypothetical protein
MNPWALVWLVVFAVAALCFFGTALVIIIVGVGDLRDLLTTAAERAERNS